MNIFRTFAVSAAAIALVALGAGIASAETGENDAPSNANRTSVQLPDEGFINIDLYPTGALAVDGLLPESGYFDSIFAIDVAVVGWFPEEGQGGRDYAYVTNQGHLVTGHSGEEPLYIDPFK